MPCFVMEEKGELNITYRFVATCNATVDGEPFSSTASEQLNLQQLEETRTSSEAGPPHKKKKTTYVLHMPQT